MAIRRTLTTILFNCSMSSQTTRPKGQLRIMGPDLHTMHIMVQSTHSILNVQGDTGVHMKLQEAKGTSQFLDDLTINATITDPHTWIVGPLKDAALGALGHDLWCVA